MRLIYGGIHKRIGCIIQHCGGYDREYHITSVAKELNIERGFIERVFNHSIESNLNHYLDLLRNGMDVEKVVEMIEFDNEIATKNFHETFDIMNNYLAKTRREFLWR